MKKAIRGARIFDGETILDGRALVFSTAGIEAIVSNRHIPGECETIAADGKLIAPGLIDLQVNGGGGLLFNNAPTVDGLRTICAAQVRSGVTALLPTLITDGPDVVRAAIEAGKAAFSEGVPGYLGLHLEGPHLSLARKGTHDPALIRPMTKEDCDYLVDNAGLFGIGLLTVAPENVTRQQVARLKQAGYIVSLGHTDTSAAVAREYRLAGASMATHLFNAMSPLGHREPGVVGAVLADGGFSAGLIADGFHVDPLAMGIALKAKAGPGKIFLVSDAMSVTGTDLQSFELNGRTIYRKDGRLTLADGTLAGADTDLLTCVRNVRDMAGLSLEEALRMASLYPARAVGALSKGRLTPGADADFILLDNDLALSASFIAGENVLASD